MTDTVTPVPLIFFDRSRRVQDWKCRRSRYWAYEYEGLGISPAKRALYFDIGDHLHRGLAALLRQEGDLEEIVRDVVEGFRGVTHNLEGPKQEEQCALVEGILRGWARVVLPRILQEYRVLHVEEEFPYERGRLRLGVTPDALLERLTDETLWYREHKTTGYLDDRWFPQWPKAIQLHSTAQAVGARLGREVTGVIVGGLYKGYENRKAGGRQESIFCYGYVRPATIGGEETLYEWRAGSRKVPVWEMPGGVRRWVQQMPQHVVEAQFAETPPIFLNDLLVEAFWRQTEPREVEIREAREAIALARSHGDEEAVTDLLDRYFPQSFDQCAPAIGSACPFSDVCFNPIIQRDPLRSGLYVWRRPHHALDPCVQEEVG